MIDHVKSPQIALMNNCESVLIHSCEILTIHIGYPLHGSSLSSLLYPNSISTT
jgi:hypothetical protein